MFIELALFAVCVFMYEWVDLFKTFIFLCRKTISMDGTKCHTLRVKQTLTPGTAEVAQMDFRLYVTQTALICYEHVFPFRMVAFLSQ